MSSVRMCDNPNCGEIFSEAEAGWSTAVQQQMREDSNGNRRTVQVAVDLCPDCAGDTQEVARKLSEQRRNRRIARLELTAGVGNEDPIETELRRAERQHD